MTDPANKRLPSSIRFGLNRIELGILFAVSQLRFAGSALQSPIYSGA